MEVRLVIEHGRTRKRTFYLRKDENVIGRQKGNAIRIPSPEVSRRHCLLRMRDGYVMVEDLGSSNGTQLNGDDVKGSQVVRPGDRLRIGPVTFIVEYQLTADAIDRLLRGEADEGAGFDVVEEGDEAAIPLEVEDDEEAIPVEALDDLEAPQEVTPVEEEVEELEPIDADAYQLPHSEDLRDILTGLDEDSSEKESQGYR
jgi:pSer/pThr/pTyr-binding forkhead associated (FHA) protein